jgi:hypothetical protein
MSKTAWSWRLVCRLVALACAGLAGGCANAHDSGDSNKPLPNSFNGDSYKPLPKSFEGDSGQLQRTVIVPTLDSPIPENKSAIWCSAFQIAWNHLKTDLVKEPVQLKDAEALAKSLNDAPQSEADLPPGTFYAAAGYVKDGIVDQIRSDMAKRFPNSTFPPLEALPLEVAIAYAYLASGVELTRPFQVNDKPLLFKDSKGHESPVHSFGLVKGAGTEGIRQGIAGQISLLSKDSATEYVLDLCWNSRPNQIVVARLPRQLTLAKTLQVIKDRNSKPTDGRPRLGAIREKDEVLIPMMHWRVSRHFQELEHKDFLNPLFRGYFIGRAMEDLDFLLDERGARLEAQAVATVAKGLHVDEPKRYVMDGPFLIYLQKHGAAHPFFVMWVDNAELLQPDSSLK